MTTDEAREIVLLALKHYPEGMSECRTQGAVGITTMLGSAHVLECECGIDGGDDLLGSCGLY